MIFYVTKTEHNTPWEIRHRPSGLACGYFTYQVHANAACRDMNALADIESDLHNERPTNDSLTDLLAARAPHVKADRERAAKRGSRRSA